MPRGLNEAKARTTLIEVGKQMYERGYITGLEGNLSIRLDPRVILTTPAGTCKGRLEPNELILINLDGDLLPGQTGKASTESGMHLTVYRERPEINAVVHAHPTTAVAFTVAGLSLEKCILPEVVCTFGSIPVAPYATPSTDEVSQSIIEIVKTNDALLLDHHGALTLSKDIWDAYYKLETLEHYAQTMLIAHMLGGAKPLKTSQVKKLMDICSTYGLQRPHNEETLLSARCSTPDGD